jgi:hypothetical protein
MTIPTRFALLALAAGLAQFPVAACAQDKPAPAPLVYESAFADYRSDKDNAPVDWKESNARVAQPRDEHAGHDMAAMKHHNHAKPAPAPAPEAKNKDPHQGHQHKE